MGVIAPPPAMVLELQDEVARMGKERGALEVLTTGQGVQTVLVDGGGRFPRWPRD